MTHHVPGTSTTVVLVLLVLALAAAYVVPAVRRSRDARGWSGWRTASFVGGCALLVVALVPQLSPYPPGDLRGHMLQHLLIGMYAPLALVLGAPGTLALRSLPHRHARRLGRTLASAPVALLAHPVTGLVLTVGGLLVLYLTPLHAIAAREPVVGHLVHLHFLLGGCAFAHAIAGPDAAPHRPSVPARLVVLGVAIVVHAVLAQVMYAGLLTQLHAPPAQVRGGAELMYYGGDVAELLLALALVRTWRPARTATTRVGHRSGETHVGP